MKQLKVIGVGILVIRSLWSCDVMQDTVVTVPNSINQWPMSGGPDGSWKINTNDKVPTHWSVRTGEHIKWKTSLPEGGQSGIAVWKDKLFLTINPPNKNATYRTLLENFNSIKKTYELLLEQEIKKLNEKKDKTFLTYKKELETIKSKWQEVLAKNSYYQHMSELEKPRGERNMMRKDKVGKLYAIALKKYNTYIYTCSDELKKISEKLEKSRKAKNGGAQSKDIVLLCLNSETGSVLWKRTIKGVLSSQYNYGFSDATTPCPMTDGKNVWAINASGGMACFTMTGALIWERTWMPTSGRPFNKQFDSVLFDNLVLNVEPPVTGDVKRNSDWNYLHAFDKTTGKRVWVTQQALTHYNTPILGTTADGKPAILMGRGGPHGVPERPLGLSLISLEKNDQGSEIWNWEPKEPNNSSGWGALSTQHWDQEKASWFYKGDKHATINTKTGKLIAQKALNLVNKYNFDVKSQKYVLSKDVKIKGLQNQRHCNILTDDLLYYMVRYQPYIAKHNVLTGLNEHLELPRDVDSNRNYIWKHAQTNDGLNSQGQLNAADARTRGNGFQKCFLGSPTMINNYIFFTNAVGMVYVIDVNAEKFDESALVAVNDLGESGKTWSVNSLSYANGKIYHRTMKEVVCIE